MPKIRQLVLTLLPPLLHFVFDQMIYQLYVIQQATPCHLFVHSGSHSKSLKSTFCTYLLIAV